MPEWSHRVETGAGTLTCLPFTLGRLGELDDVFGDRGTARRCYCTYWRRPGGERRGEEDNRERFLELIDHDRPPGLIGYLGGQPVGWVQVGPRQDFPAIHRSRLLRPVDDVQPWSVNCFVVRTGWRRRGIAGGLLDAAIRYAGDQGAEVIEAYPVDGERSSAVDYYTGTFGMFLEHGFEEVVRRNQSRPVVRLTLRSH